MNVKRLNPIRRFAPRTLMAIAALAAGTTMASAQGKSFSPGQSVVIKSGSTWYLGKFSEYSGGAYWVVVKSTPTSTDEQGVGRDSDVMSLDDAKKQNIAYTDLNAGNAATQAPKTDVPPVPVHVPAVNNAPAANTAAASKNLRGGDLVFVRKNGKWERGQIRGQGFANGKTTYHVQVTGGGMEAVDNMDNIVSAADGIKAGYFTKTYPNMTLSTPSANYTTTGVACGRFCIITYTGAFTPNAQAASITGKPGTVWSGPLADAIIRVTNEVRQNPTALANELDNNLMKYSYDWDQMTDVLDAISYLRKVKPVGPLTNSDVMSRVNSDYISWYQVNGKTPHQGPNNNWPWDRVKPYGTFTGAGMAENMSGSGPNPATMNQLTAAEADAIARQVVYELIIDTGASNRAKRGHRVTIYNGQSITY